MVQTDANNSPRQSPAQTTIDSLKKQLTEANQTCDNYHKQLVALTNKLAAVQNDLLQNQEQVTQLKAEKKGLSVKLRNLQQKVELARNEVSLR
jgi:uncharacterized coiled-coil protein SlyX